jgi:hypothetical protein
MRFEVSEAKKVEIEIVFKIKETLKFFVLVPEKCSAALTNLTDFSKTLPHEGIP